MADFQGIFCRPFLLSVLMIEGVGGMGGGMGWGGMEWGGMEWGGMEWGGMGRGGWGGRWQKSPLGTLYEQP